MNKAQFLSHVRGLAKVGAGILISYGATTGVTFASARLWIHGLILYIVAQAFSHFAASDGQTAPSASGKLGALLMSGSLAALLLGATGCATGTTGTVQGWSIATGCTSNIVFFGEIRPAATNSVAVTTGSNTVTTATITPAVKRGFKLVLPFNLGGLIGAGVATEGL